MNITRKPGATAAAESEADIKLAEAIETLRAIRSGEVDALVVADGSPGEQVFTLSSADRPYRMFVEHMRDGAATVSEDGLVLYANRRLAEILSKPLSDIIAAPLSSLVVGRPPCRARGPERASREPGARSRSS